jgi:glycyl-tRNA synthetase beta subunit
LARGQAGALCAAGALGCGAAGFGVVPLEIAGIAAGNASRGHRVLHGEKPVVIEAAEYYSEEALRKAFVVVDVAERRQSIRKALDAATRTVAGARWREDEALVETVVHLTEWPSWCWATLSLSIWPCPKRCW